MFYSSGNTTLTHGHYLCARMRIYSSVFSCCSNDEWSRNYSGTIMVWQWIEEFLSEKSGN